MACTGLPFKRRTRKRASLYAIWAACYDCGCFDCLARLDLECRPRGVNASHLGGVIVNSSVPLPPVRYPANLMAAVKKKSATLAVWVETATHLLRIGHDHVMPPMQMHSIEERERAVILAIDLLHRYPSFDAVKARRYATDDAWRQTMATDYINPYL